MPILQTIKSKWRSYNASKKSAITTSAIFVAGFSIYLLPVHLAALIMGFVLAGVCFGALWFILYHIIKDCYGGW